MAKEKMEQFITNGIRNGVDNLVLQNLLKSIDEAKLHKDDLVKFILNKCPFSNKQRFVLEGNDEDAICMFCEKPTDENVLVYQVEQNKQIICLESEAENLIK